MAKLYDEIFYAAYLLQEDRNGKTTLAPKTRQKIAGFMAQAKKSLQTMTAEQGARDRKDKGLRRDSHGRIDKGGIFYIKSFYFDIETNALVLYTRIFGQDTRLDVAQDKGAGYRITIDRGGICPPKIARFLAGVLDYWIPSENSLEKYSVSLMPAWRHNPHMG